jgi:cell division septation protein DedD
MSNKHVAAIFAAGVGFALIAFWAGLTVIRNGSAMKPATAQQSQYKQQDRARYIVRVATFGTAAEANKLAAELRARKYLSAYVQPPGSEDLLYRVNIGPYDDREMAEQVADQLAAEGRKGVTVITRPQE